MPEECYYHKHLMYNVGIVLAREEICLICDSDAMVGGGLVRAIVDVFKEDANIVLHVDPLWKIRRDIYRFAHSGFEEVLEPGRLNNVGGDRAGILDTEDPIHTRNYGAGTCARRDALINISGSDEPIDFLGHILGPYDMTFWLSNAGVREVWHRPEFMYHAWHLGQAGVDNNLSAHDARHVSSTSLEARTTGRIVRRVENAAIRRLREPWRTAIDVLLTTVVDPANSGKWLCI